MERAQWSNCRCRLITNSSASAATLTVNNPSPNSYAGIIGGNLNLIKGSTGTLALSGANNYSGGTTVSGGTLLANSSSPNSATGAGPVNITGGILGGTGNVAGQVNVKAGGTISAGSESLLSPDSASAVGALTTGSQTWYGGGAYVWTINNASQAGGVAGTPGSDWDLLSVSGLSLDSSTVTTPFTIKVDFLNELSANNFNPSASYSWKIAHASDSSFSSVTAAQISQSFVLDTSAFASAYGTTSAEFTLLGIANTSGSDLEILYTATPEPTSITLFGSAVVGVLLARRRRVG